MKDDSPIEAPDGPSGAWADRVDGYRGLTLLGRGGTATVYSASRRSDGEPVAIKVFDVPESVPFARQIRMSERLRAVPGVLRVDDRGLLDDGRPYLVTPFAQGGSLADLMERFGGMPPARVAALGARLARSLGAAHATGVLHNDLKPSNVLLDADGSPLLADFGAATLVEPETASDTMAVTIIYAAPEVLEGAAPTERSDLYSLGLTLLALATGAHPFGGSDDPGLATLVNRICTTGAPDPAELGVADGLAAVLRRATELDPDGRYATGDELADALERHADGSVITVASTSDRTGAAAGAASSEPRAGAASSPRARRWSAAMGTALALVTVGGAVWWTVDRGSDPDDPASTITTSTTTSTTMTSIAALGDPVTEANGILGPLYAQDDFAYGGQLTEECAEGDRRVALAIHADQNDRAAGVAEPWVAVAGENAGTFMAYLPCESGGRNIRYVLRAPGRWFTVVAQFPDAQYDRMVEWMRENETSPAPDYTVDDEIRATLGAPENYEGWAIVDRAE